VFGQQPLQFAGITLYPAVLIMCFFRSTIS
jgi:hypothetical protein